MSLVKQTMQGLITGCGVANITLCQTVRLIYTTNIVNKKWKYHPDRDLNPPEPFKNVNQPPDR